MERYQKSYQKACMRAKDVASVLRTQEYFTGPDPEHITFCIPFSDKRRVITAISISAVKLIESNDPDTKVLEIALIGIDGRCTYISDLGYADVCCFDDVDQVMEEIDRLKSLR